MRIVTVAGARPNFVKVAPILRALAAARPPEGVDSLLVDTGQHYDDAMSAALFRDLELPAPARALRVGSGSHAVQTAAVLTAFEATLLELRPDLVVVVGDVNSTLACALAAAKLGVRVAHVEAGLRSRDRSMPEEINRVLTDALADFLFTSEESANENLRREGVADERVFFVGNVMVDSLRWAERRGRRSAILEQLGLRAAEPFAVVTLHRPSNVDERGQLAGLVESLRLLASDLPVLFVAHPRTRARLDEFGLGAALRPLQPGASERAPRRGEICLLGALPYVDWIALLRAARVALTDSGGVQEETTCLGVPCVTVRETTERPITTSAGTSILAGAAPARVLHHARRALELGRPQTSALPLWDGCAAERLVDVLLARP